MDGPGNGLHFPTAGLCVQGTEDVIFCTGLKFELGELSKALRALECNDTKARTWPVIGPISKFSNKNESSETD